MTTPPRLSDDARDVLAAYRQAAPGSKRRRANLDAVLQRVEEDAPPRAAAAAGLLWPIGWGLASAAAAAGLIWGVITVRAPEPAAPPSEDTPAVEEATPPKAPRPRPAPEQPAEAVVPPPVQAPAARATAPKVVDVERVEAPRASDLREETRMLRAVRASIGKDALDEAARHLEAYTVAFPNGALREDAQAYRVIVACKRGRPASALRDAFARRYPDSPHAVRIAAACEGEKE